MQIRIVRGAKAGVTHWFDGETIRAGRGPLAELRFDPVRDLDVSALHAVLFRKGSTWFVRDLGSTNGTWLNGARVEGDAQLADGDAIDFGTDGPRIEVWMSPRAADTSRTQLLRAIVRRQHRTLRLTLAASAIALAVLALSLLRVTIAGREERAEAQRERRALLATIDSQLVSTEATLHSLRGQMDSLASALRLSEAKVRETRNALARVPPGDDSAAALRQQLRSASEALARQQLAASIDFPAIEEQNRPAVALVFVEGDDGQVATATAFAVRSDGLLLTVRHVLTGADNTRTPRRIAIQFSDSEQFFPARIVAVAQDADLVIVRALNLLGSVPVVLPFVREDDRLAPGQPVAVIGYPAGGETPVGRIGEAVARPLMTAGILLSVSDRQIEVQGYGAAGASGSPVFAADGRVAAIIVGGRTGVREGRLVAVPAPAAARLLESVR